MGLFGRDDTDRRHSAPQGPQALRGDHPSGPAGDGDRTVVASTAHFEGKLTGSGEVTVHGTVTGRIEGSGAVRIASRGTVVATVHGRSVTVAGTVTGDITADERIELEPSATVDGDITAPRILIKEGATFRGQVNMQPPAGRQRAGDVQPPAPEKAGGKV